MGRRATEKYDFYCINCGNKGIPLQRSKSLKHEKFHRKKLYCLTCKAEVNHVECKSQEEVEQFLIDFERGVFKDEAEESLSIVRDSWGW